MADNKTMQLGIVVDDGSVREVIRNTHGDEIGVFVFRPTDVGMIDRYNKIIGDFDKITAPLESVNISANGEAESGDDVALQALQQAEKQLYAACDYLFGGNMSEAFFGKMHPFSPVGGRFYCEVALDAVGKYISAQFNRETQRAKQRVERYTAGYKPASGKHSRGRNRGHR